MTAGASELQGWQSLFQNLSQGPESAAQDARARGAMWLSHLDRHGWKTWHGVPVETEKVDHLAIGPGGVFAITSITASTLVEVERNRILVDGQDNGILKHMKRQAKDLARALGRLTTSGGARKPHVEPVLLVIAPELDRVAQPKRGLVLHGREIIAYLRTEDHVLEADARESLGGAVTELLSNPA